MKKEGAERARAETRRWLGREKGVNSKLFDERERSVKGKWALSLLIYVSEGTELLADFIEAGTKARHAAREE